MGNNILLEYASSEGQKELLWTIVLATLKVEEAVLEMRILSLVIEQSSILEKHFPDLTLQKPLLQFLK